jgi:hypothetical protein
VLFFFLHSIITMSTNNDLYGSVDFSDDSYNVSGEGSDKKFWPKKAMLVSNVVINTAMSEVKTTKTGKTYLRLFLETTTKSEMKDFTGSLCNEGGQLGAIAPQLPLRWDIYMPAPPTKTDANKHEYEKLVEKWQDKMKKFLSRLKHLLTKYVTEEKFEKWRANKSFNKPPQELFPAILKILRDSKAEKTLIRVKTIISEEGWAEIPMYPSYLETMESAPSWEDSKERDKLKFDPDFDRITPPIADASHNGGSMQGGEHDENLGTFDESDADMKLTPDGDAEEDSDDLTF